MEKAQLRTLDLITHFEIRIKNFCFESANRIAWSMFINSKSVGLSLGGLTLYLAL